MKNRRSHSVSKKHSNSVFDHFIYLVAFAGPIMTLPQIDDIWIKRQATINEITWFSYFMISLIWLIYGIRHGEKPIILSNFLGIITNGLVVLGAFVYS